MTNHVSFRRIFVGLALILIAFCMGAKFGYGRGWRFAYPQGQCDIHQGAVVHEFGGQSYCIVNNRVVPIKVAL